MKWTVCWRQDSETINVALHVTHHHMLKKKDGSNMVCYDFKKLNKITEVDPEPMTTAKDLVLSTQWYEISVQD